MIRFWMCCLAYGISASLAYGQLGMTFEEAEQRFPLVPTKLDAIAVKADDTIDSSLAHPSVKGKTLQYRDVILPSAPGRNGRAAKLSLVFFDGVVMGVDPQENGVITSDAILRSLRQRVDGKDLPLRWIPAKSLAKAYPPTGQSFNYSMAWPSTTTIGSVTTLYSNGSTSTQSLSVNDGMNMQFEQSVYVHTWNFKVDPDRKFVLEIRNDSTRSSRVSTLSPASQGSQNTVTYRIRPRDYFWYSKTREILSQINTHVSTGKNKGIPEEAWGVFAANRLASFYAAYLDTFELEIEEAVALYRIAVQGAKKSYFKPQNIEDVILAHVAFELEKMCSTPEGERRMCVLAEVGGKKAVPAFVDLLGSRRKQAKDLAGEYLNTIAEKHKLPSPPTADATLMEWRRWADGL